MSLRGADRGAGAAYAVRPLVPSDSERVAAIYNTAVRDTLATLDTEEKSPQYFRDWLDGHDERYVALAATDGDTLVGYGSLSPFAARGGYRASAEMSIYLEPAHTARGVGRALAERLIAHGRAVGFTGILSVVTSTNTPALRLVERLGFVYSGTLRRIGAKHGHVVDLVCHQLVFEENVARHGRPADEVWG